MKKFINAIKEINSTLNFLIVFEAILNTVIFFLVVYFLLSLVNLFPIIAAVPAVIYFIMRMKIDSKKDKRKIVESKYAPLKEKLRTASDNINEENPALSLANWIIGVPIIYYPYGLQAAAIRFKNSLQENAKTHAVTEDVIEACHNGIVSWERKSNFQPIFLQGNDDYIKTKERWKILKEFFITNNIEFWENTSVHGDILSKLIHLIYLYDYASIFLAVKNNIDPSPVKSIDFIKNHI